MSDQTRPLTDVRMHGFARRSEVRDVVEWIDGCATPLDAESVALDDGAGRVLAVDVIAPIDVPGFDRAAMDGYGLRGADTAGATDYNPLPFPVVGQALPAMPYGANVAAGAAVRVMTGAPMPSELDAVVPVEYATESGGQIEITRPVAPGQHVGRVGEDIAAGTRVLAAGRHIRAQDLGVLASLGLASVDVVRRPRVRILVTGFEVVVPGQPKGAYQIYDANSAMLRAIVARDGGSIEGHHRLKDDPVAIRERLLAPGADIILVSGGSSVGSEDHAPRLVAEAGELNFHGIAMRPSSPAGCGRIGTALVFLLPGNPVSCLCAYDFFAGRAIRLRGGQPGTWPHRVRTGIVARKIVSAIGRVDYCRVRVTGNEIEPLALSGASILSSTTRADGFVIIPSESEGYGPGTEISVYLYD